MKPQLIAFTGYARAGKDDFAAALVRRGFSLLNFGHIIKDFFKAYIAGTESMSQLRLRMFEVNPELTRDQFDVFFKEVLLPWEWADIELDAHTEHTPDKAVLRPILEKGGDLIYDHVMNEYFRRVDAMTSAGKSVASTRLVRVREGLEWDKRGGLIYEVDRKDWKPASEWEFDALVMLSFSGLISGVLKNHGTLEEWHAQAEAFAERLIPSEVAI